MMWLLLSMTRNGPRGASARRWRAGVTPMAMLSTTTTKLRMQAGRRQPRGHRRLRRQTAHQLAHERVTLIERRQIHRRRLDPERRTRGSGDLHVSPCRLLGSSADEFCLLPYQ